MAKFGIALGSGPRGPGFESRHSDQIKNPVTAKAVAGFFILVGWDSKIQMQHSSGVLLDAGLTAPTL